MKCPKCEKAITYMVFSSVETKQQFKPGNAYHAVAHMCPLCLSVLSVEMDPIAVKADIVNALMKRLGRA